VARDNLAIFIFGFLMRKLNNENLQIKSKIISIHFASLFGIDFIYWKFFFNEAESN